MSTATTRGDALTLPLQTTEGNSVARAQKSRAQKPNAKRVALSIARRLVHPRHALELVKCFRKTKASSRAVDDAQLKLYADILPGDFLNYGFFENPAIPPEKLSLHDIQQAQVRYGQLLIDQIRDKRSPVLDAGCGMGGLLNLLVAQGFTPTALTPNRSQIDYVQSRHPDVPMVEGKFESIPAAKYGHYFGTVITSESFQYMKLAAGLATVKKVLAPRGRWILCDYFRIYETKRRSGHGWADFNKAVKNDGWKIVTERDITSNVLPTVAYIDMWGQRVARPMVEFALGKLKRKWPALHYLLDDAIQELRTYLLEQLSIVNPEVFSREKKYMLLVMERA